jgi:hypothetical protein
MELQNNELRIGNLFILPNGDIGKISYHEIRLMVVAIEKPDYQPIPLTEEWLLKFGFEKRTTVLHSVQYFIGFNPITHDWMFDILWLVGHEYPFYRNGHFAIKYVHQLQNLYFALTGEELTIKENE